MKASQFLISTLKEAPADAEVVSHKLMMRAGMIKKLGAGIYSYMPMGLRVIRKVEAIVREEMNKSAAIELLMPLIQPASVLDRCQVTLSSGVNAGKDPELSIDRIVLVPSLASRQLCT